MLRSLRYGFSQVWPFGGGMQLEPEVERYDIVPSHHSMTAFSGTPAEWNAYLSMEREDRYDDDFRIHLRWMPEQRELAFDPATPGAVAAAGFFQNAWDLAARRAHTMDFVWKTIEMLVFDNRANGDTGLILRTSTQIPSDGTREVRTDDSMTAVAADLVFRRRSLEEWIDRWKTLPADTDEETRLGVCMPGFIQLLANLGYPNHPRDRFVERIDLTRHIALVAINLMFTGKRYGRLIPNGAGVEMRRFWCEDSGLSDKDLDDHHDRMALYHQLSFLLSEQRAKDYLSQANIIVRQFLDDRYVRLSVAELLPPVQPAFTPMDLRVQGRKAITPPPVIGRHGIIDREDRRAWSKVQGAFERIGFPLVRQLGMGQFGRVYEAVNLVNSALPRRVAIKVDRLTRRGKNPIQDPVMASELGNRLAAAPHVIRLFDTGRLERLDMNYHILQLIDGETLDDLIGVTGREHASVAKPLSPASADDAEREVRVALSGSHGERWRIRGHETAFNKAVGLNQVFDILTSILLWIEEIHGLGFAINDLKNGNLMLSRSGQLKGIDLDTYAPAFSPMERMVDFKFLAVSLVLFLVNAREQQGSIPTLDGGLMRDPQAFRRYLDANWAFGDVADLSHGRVETEDVKSLLTRLVVGCGDNSFAHNAPAFEALVDEFIHLKRRCFLEETVLD